MAPEAVRQAVGGGCKAVGGGYCRLQMLLRLALGVRGTVSGHRPSSPEGGGGSPPPFKCIPAPPPEPPLTHPRTLPAHPLPTRAGP